MRVKVQLLVVSTALSAAFFAPAASLQTMPAASLHLHEHGHGITPLRPLAASARQLETCREDIGENAASTAALKMPRRHLAFGAAAALLLPMIAAPHKAQAAELLEQGASVTAESLRQRLEGDAAGLRQEAGAGGGGGLLPSFGGNGDKILVYPEWMLGTWKVTSRLSNVVYPTGSPPPALQEGVTVRGKSEKKGVSVSYLQRFNGTAARKLGSKPSQIQVVEDVGYNLQQVWNSFHTEPVLSTDFSYRMDPTYARLVIDDGLGEDQPAASYSFSTSRTSADGGGGETFLASESFRGLFVASKSVQVTEYERVSKVERINNGTLRASRRDIVYLAPEAVQDKIAKMRSLGSLRAWGALTKGTVKEGSIGVDLKGGRRAVAVFDYDLLFEKE